jgi:hypothetical protein
MHHRWVPALFRGIKKTLKTGFSRKSSRFSKFFFKLKVYEEWLEQLLVAKVGLPMLGS